MEHAGGNWLCHVLPSLPDRVKESLLTLWSVTKFPDRVKESLLTLWSVTKFPDRVKKSLLTLWSVTKFPDRVKKSLHADPVVSDLVSRSCQGESAC